MGTVANQALQLMHKGSLEITFAVPLMKERKHAFGRKKTVWNIYLDVEISKFTFKNLLAISFNICLILK